MKNKIIIIVLILIIISCSASIILINKSSNANIESDTNGIITKQKIELNINKKDTIKQNEL